MISFLLNVLRYWIALYSEYTEGHISRGNAPKCILVYDFRSSPKVIDVTLSFLFFNGRDKYRRTFFFAPVYTNKCRIYEIRCTSMRPPRMCCLYDVFQTCMLSGSLGYLKSRVNFVMFSRYVNVRICIHLWGFVNGRWVTSLCLEQSRKYI